MLTEAGFADWLARYEAAWETRDPAAAMALFTTDGTYRETPFDEPMAGRAAIGAYWRTRVAEGQDRVDFCFEVLAGTGDVGLASWRARFDWRPRTLEQGLRLAYGESAGLSETRT